MRKMFATQLNRLLTAIKNNPSLLKRQCNEKRTFLRSQGNLEAQGTGNQVTEHEAAFATTLEEFGFKFVTKKNLPISEDGYFYIYQAQGTQQSVDFQVLERKEATTVLSLNIDLKYSTSDKIMLNDGWFNTNVVYICTFKPKKSDFVTLISLGQDLCNEEDTNLIKELRELKNTLNEKYKKRGKHLISYWRNANKYNLSEFSHEEARLHTFKETLKYVETLEEQPSLSDDEALVSLAQRALGLDSSSE